MPLARRRKEVSETWQPKLWLVLGALLLVVAYLIAFVVKNDDEVKVDFVVTSARTSLIWTVLLSLVLGLVAGVLLSQLYRRRGRYDRRQSRDPLGDGGAGGVAER